YILFFSLTGFSQNETGKEETEKYLAGEIQLLQKYFFGTGNWLVTHNELGRSVHGLIHFIEDEPIDTILQKLSFAGNDSTFNFVLRLPENVPDSLTVPGYFPWSQVETSIEHLGLELQTQFQKKELTVPLHLLTNLEEKVALIGPDETMELFTDSLFRLPDSLQVPEVLPDTMMQTTEDFQRLLKLDSLRYRFMEQKRIAYNDSLLTAYRDSVIARYRQDKFEEEYNFRKKNLIDSVRLNNYEILKNYNDSVVKAVNDSILNAVRILTEYADIIDTSKIVVSNLYDESAEVGLQNGKERFTRVWLKNKQNDSLSVLIRNLDKRSVQMLIDDGVTFSRFSRKETKDFDFSSFNKKVAGLTNVGKMYEKETPWRIGGNGNVGFTQTYLENWKKGGKSALSLLLLLKGFANYSSADGKVKWENSTEIRNGWIRPGGSDSELQKNDDKFEFTSRFGLSAFKKWYYSAELNYNTQFFRGYRYPTSTNPTPISSFMAPARTFFKIGLNYKPNKEFSLLLSPLTLKNVFVRDTSKIDQTKFGIAAHERNLWESGLNADVHFKKSITPDISYETKYKMFINYKQPFKKFDINWENLFVMRLNDYINMRLLVHLIYDDDVLFPVYDANNVKTGEAPKLQIKQLITVGFSYKINRQVMRTKRVR
ncbi:MAG: DUF3078 domain-containing protein, partial [Prolixibacteraceae bacterium]|nr:DUF3078 domain-containing protein [Prolixibacteraceae bacterium]